MLDRKATMTWQSIDTAPRDGTEMLLLVNGKPFIGHYSVSEHFEHGKLIHRHEGWVYGRVPVGGRPEPTNWQLIEPPEDNSNHDQQ
jgi:hypothetical protein